MRGLLILLAVLVLTGVGYSAYRVGQASNKPKTETTQTKTDTQKSKAEPVANDGTQGWKTFTDKSLSLKYPTSWFAPINDEACGTEGLRRGTTVEAAGVCQSDAVAQIRVYAESGDIGKDLAPKDEFSTDIKSTDVTVASVPGKRYTSVQKGENLAQEEGVKVVQYIFYTNNKTYVARYTDNHGRFKDALSDFDLMITKTLQFKKS